MKTRNYEQAKQKEQKYISYILPILSKNSNYSIYLPPSQYARYDAIVTTDKSINYIEYKIRDKSYETVLLEVSKFENLMIYQKPYYIITDDDATYIFNLKKIDFKKLATTEIRCPRTAVSNTNYYYDADYITKKCFLIPKTEAEFVLNIKNNDL